MDAQGIVSAIREFEGNPWRVITFKGDSAQVVMANGEVRSATGLAELKKVLGVDAPKIGCKTLR